jgi:large-conductance mechanosensitive channel
MVRRFVDLIADTWILDLAAGLLLGFAVLYFIQSLSSTIVQFWTSKGQAEGSEILGLFNSLTIKIGDRVLYLEPLVESTLTLAIAILVVVFLIRRLAAADERD